MPEDTFKWPKRISCQLLGIRVDIVTKTQLVNLIEQAIACDRRVVLAGHNLHSSYLYHSNDSFRQFYEEIADVIIADGSPVTWDSWLSQPNAGPRDRIGSTDWIPLMNQAQVHTVLAVGGSPHSSERFIQRMSSLLPGIAVHGLPGESWTDEHERDLMQLIRRCQPDVVLLGLGMPLQEAVASRIPEHWPVVIATVGGALEQLSGGQSLAPRWLGRFGLEWLWRLSSDPLRLSSRYLVEPWKLLALRLRRSRQQGHPRGT